MADKFNQNVIILTSLCNVVVYAFEVFDFFQSIHDDNIQANKGKINVNGVMTEPDGMMVSHGSQLFDSITIPYDRLISEFVESGACWKHEISLYNVVLHQMFDLQYEQQYDEVTGSEIKVPHEFIIKSPYVYFNKEVFCSTEIEMPKAKKCTFNKRYYFWIDNGHHLSYQMVGDDKLARVWRGTFDNSVSLRFT